MLIEIFLVKILRFEFNYVIEKGLNSGKGIFRFWGREQAGGKVDF